MRRVAVGAIASMVAVAGLSACSPTEMFVWQTKTGTTTTVTARAKAGPNDGGGRDFRVAVVCEGLSWWDRGPWASVDAPSSDGYYYSRVQCFENRRPVAITTERQ